jgi:tRNA nucleotidyltransferase (CCA-adding enzyme)
MITFKQFITEAKNDRLTPEHFGKLANKVFEVGGCIRDEFMGGNPDDYDYVIENTSPEEFESLYPQSKRVGASFPVYMHHGNEVALARVEKSTGASYTDFEVQAGVSIEEDLGRRDFSMNSIARNIVTGVIVDPFNGIQDIKDGILRCVNPVAFVEDPSRVYRGARFATRFHFTIEPKTATLMRQYKDQLVHILPERVEKELQKMYQQSSKPSEFFYTLRDLGILKYHFAPLDKMVNIPAGPSKYHGNNTAFSHTMEVIDKIKSMGLSFDCFVAGLVHDFGKGETPEDVLPHHYGHEIRSKDIGSNWLEEHRFSARANKLALFVALYHMKIRSVTSMRPHKMVDFFQSIPKDIYDDFISCTMADHELDQATLDRMDRMKVVKKNTVIDIPKGHADPKDFVRTAYTKGLKSMEESVASFKDYIRVV